MTLPKVSILVPIYNVENYLSYCLDSLVNQTLQEIEIICINDGSKDNSLAIIQKFALKDKRIVIIDKQNSGYGDSMNEGMKIAKGEYIGIVESDDFADKYMFERLYALTNNGSIDIVRSNYYEYWDSKGDASSFYANISNYERVINLMEEKELLMLPPAIWSAIYRRRFLLDHGIYFLPTPGASYQDTSFFIKTLFLAETILYTRDMYLHYRQDNAFSSVKQCNLAKAVFVHTEFEEADIFLRKHPKRFKEIESIYNSKKLKAFLWNLYRVEKKKDYLQLMRKASFEILTKKLYEKYLFSKSENICLFFLRNNINNGIYLLLNIQMIKSKFLN